MMATMHTEAHDWNLDLMRRVSSLRVASVVDEQIAYGDRRKAAEDLIRRRFTRVALEELQVNVDAKDIRITWGDIKPSNQRRINAHWEPVEVVAQIVGGPDDGRTILHTRAGRDHLHTRQRIPSPEGPKPSAVGVE